MYDAGLSADEKKKMSRLVLYLLLALYVSILETLIPKPAPFLKLGLANVVTLAVLEKEGFRMGLTLTTLRVLIQHLAFGTILTPGFFISLSAGLAAVFVMGALFRARQGLSLVAISVAAAFTHNLVQLLVVWALLFRNISLYSRYTLYFIAFFLSMGILSGLVTGVLCARLTIRKRKKTKEK
jgi:heptaprenyl diphosphate synthase